MYKECFSVSCAEIKTDITKYGYHKLVASSLQKGNSSQNIYLSFNLKSLEILWGTPACFDNKI